MYLKSLTLKGFKSFADSTTLELEPGITVVVGPNGSGKSNVVDAVAWVLGAQGPKVVRSGKMDDVIFAGTAKRPALGRAEVTLVIDNSSGRLPVDLSEINITRTLFRSGDSEYQINGAACRLLDVQELLSDAGVGRTQHVIISQGQLDAILQARQEDRRAVIEEAAGILKYRRRKERAERRLDASESSLARLEDLWREVKRQIKPLERQAKAAKDYNEITTGLRSLGIYLAGRELAALDSKRSTSGLELEKLSTSRDELLQILEETDKALSFKQEVLDKSSYNDNAVYIGRVGQLFEFGRGLNTRFGERLRFVEASLNSVRALPDLDQTKAMLTDTVDLQSGLESEIRSLSEKIEEVLAAEQLLAGERQAYLDQEAAKKLDRNQSLLAGYPIILPDSDSTINRKSENGDYVTSIHNGSQVRDGSSPKEPSAVSLSKELNKEVLQVRDNVAAKRKAWASVKESETRLLERLKGISQRITETQASFSETDTQLAETENSLTATQVEYDSAVEVLKTAEIEFAKANEAKAAVTADLHGALAKAEALEFALNEARSRAGIEHLGDNQGVLGTLLDVVDVSEELTKAFEAAVGVNVGNAVLVKSDYVQQALETLANKKLSGTLVPVPPYGNSVKQNVSDRLHFSQNVVLLRQFILAKDEQVSLLLDLLLDDVWLCRGQVSDAIDAYLSHPDATIVTQDGSCFAPKSWRLVHETVGATQAAFDRVSQSMHDLKSKVAKQEDLRQEAEESLRLARSAAESINKLVIEQTAKVERLARAKSDLTSTLSDLTSQDKELQNRYESVSEELNGLSVSLSEQEARLAALEEKAEEISARAAKEAEEIAERAKYLEEERNRERAVLADFDQKAKAHMVLRRDLEVRAASLEERYKNLEERKKNLEDTLQRQIAEFENLQKEEPILLAKHSLIASCLLELKDVLDLLSNVKEELTEADQAQNAERDRVLDELKRLRANKREGESKLSLLAEQIKNTEISIVETDTRIKSQQELLMAEFHVSKVEALEAPRPQIPPGMSLHDYQKSLQRELRLIGPVNSLAEDELRQLKERESFLEAQLSDIRSARRELNQVIKAIDKEIMEVFLKAYNDVANHFEQLFATLFPGGHGKLSLTSPDDLLNTGIEIEARPVGRNVRRLSLLSGGERSLVAVAFLFAVFRSRPSPFYLMDEVEAALDEVNLRRFLKLLEEFRHEAQLIIVSHQKKTMEVADALYGISMAPGASSKAVSEKVLKAGRSQDLIGLREAAREQQPADTRLGAGNFEE